MNTMKCTIEKFRAYAVLVFLILFSCILLSNGRNTTTTHNHVETGDWSEMSISTYEGITVVSNASARTQSARINVSVIIMAIAVALMLFLYLAGNVAINIYGRCIVPVWRVVRYIHISDGEKGADIVTA